MRRLASGNDGRSVGRLDYQFLRGWNDTLHPGVGDLVSRDHVGDWLGAGRVGLPLDHVEDAVPRDDQQQLLLLQVSQLP